MKLSTAVGIIIILTFFLLPILTNFAVIPEDMKPQNIGEFLGGVFQYWIIVISKIFKF
ncbi:MAG: hypothetical protein GW779_05825 [Candidatus Altiarchaeum hamiconexum]|uniref:Uncharacterized protein n=1 Tax=Candidatus Altarchaeum hamiconexum TaxID=1803513 RepID=A0A8J7Z0D9_9ARCH|nr:hypothetical protein [Candidatus Altarchaeum hamiconexum]NCN69011.1 hypothetical protein [Candidatus Altarchaeum hamiconexum]NCS91901.1 hypothetical protein [Candidatus Altarchaeum hamiconexum]NCT00527.1 hypothetical protein [Candidatus Altarchaeum hamiconexum]